MRYASLIFHYHIFIGRVSNQRKSQSHRPHQDLKEDLFWSHHVSGMTQEHLGMRNIPAGFS